MAEAKEKSLVSDATDQLETNRQAVRRKPARDGNRRQTAQISRAIVAQEQRARRMIRAADRRRLLPDGRGRNRRSGNDKRIEPGICHRRVESSNESLTLL